MNLCRPAILENPVQTYPWGSKTAIYELLGKEPDGLTPWAELWMGAHPKAPSRVRANGGTEGLDALISKNPEAVLGKFAAEEFGSTLPYLFKVLAAQQPLSIQAHPDQSHAREGFELENQQGVPIDAPERNYRDPRGKPELICALEPFSALAGFREPQEIRRLMELFCGPDCLPEIRHLKEGPGKDPIRSFFFSLITMEDERKKNLAEQAACRAEGMDLPEAYWIRTLWAFYPGDIGVLSPVFLNLVTLGPDEAMFLAPGTIHAYLGGTGIEIMANSDNVVRSGLTGKHVDCKELMRILSFAPGPPPRIRPEPGKGCEYTYPSGAPEFSLSKIVLAQEDTWQGPETHSADILLCINGAALAKTRHGSLKVKKGQAVFIPAAAGAYEVTGSAVLYRAGAALSRKQE